MRILLIIVSISLFNIFEYNLLYSGAVFISFYFFIKVFFNTGDRFQINYLLLFMYSVNYLLFPTLMYNGLNKYQFIAYRMNLDDWSYFSVAIPSICLLYFGLNIINPKVYKIDKEKLKYAISPNEIQLKYLISICFLLTFVIKFIPTEVGFIFSLISYLRYAGLMGLLISNINRNIGWIVGGFLMEMFIALQDGMFHNLLVLGLYFIITYFFWYSPKIQIRLLMLFIIVLFLLVLQILKSDYRAQIADNQSKGFSTFFKSINTSNNSSSLNSDKFISSFSRFNQGWILSSTIENMDKTQDFQNLNLFSLYFEAAFLPRIIAPNKLNAGDIVLFNKFSGKKINNSTSMGLGIIADGYISNGKSGSYLSTFLFGLLLSVLMYFIFTWAKFNYIYMLFIFPLFCYPIRPDCESQTILGFIIKGIIAYYVIFKLTNSYFNKKIITNTNGMY